MSAAVPVVWDYWSPLAEQVVMDPNELHVGIVHDLGGCDFEVEVVVAVVPPMAGRQNEPMAAVMRDWLAAHDWKKPDGWAEWCAAHGQIVRFPDAQ